MASVSLRNRSNKIILSRKEYNFTPQKVQICKTILISTGIGEPIAAEILLAVWSAADLLGAFPHESKW